MSAAVVPQWREKREQIERGGGCGDRGELTHPPHFDAFLSSRLLFSPLCRQRLFAADGSVALCRLDRGLCDWSVIRRRAAARTTQKRRRERGSTQ